MTASKTRPATKAGAKKAPAKKAATKRLTKAEIARVDAAVERAKGSPGYPVVRAFGEIAKLGLQRTSRR